MTSYYATAFKTGSYPAITQDKIYMWARTHPKEANSPDSVPKPTNYEMVRLSFFDVDAASASVILIWRCFAQTQDTLWALVFAAEPSNVTLATSDSNSESFSVPAGVSKLSYALTSGGYMHGTISRNGQSVVDLMPANYTFNPNPPSYNYNIFVAASD